MKRMVLLIGLLMPVLPVHAGQGTIEETDSAIIVEYTGDATDFSKEAMKPEEPPAIKPTEPAVRVPKTHLNEVQKMKLEIRNAARQQRKNGTASQDTPRTEE